MTRAPARSPAGLPAHLVSPPAREPPPGWGQSLSAGAAGIMLLHIERARRGLGGWETVHAWAAAATRAPVTAGPGNGLFHGAPAVAFALHAAGQPGYAGALQALDGAITALTRRKLAAACARIDRGDLPALREYDLISGLTGIGCYLLAHHPHARECRSVLSYLVRLTEPVHHDGERLPGWWCADGPVGGASARFPGGHANLGIAHGITGPLALLALASKRRVIVPGHAGAIERICSWLDTWRQGSGTRAWWPPWITRKEHQTGRCAQAGPFRPSWCYGTPGQARAQQLAGQALGDTGRQRIAEQALLGCLSDERQLSALTGAGLCHGQAGLALTTWHAAAGARTTDLAACLPHLHARLTWQQDRPAAGLGLLEGRAGTALALLTTSATTPPPSRWDACLLTADAGTQ